MITSKKLSKFKSITHGFFDRQKGASRGIYKSLNCGLGSYDNKRKVLKNLKIVCKKIKCSPKNLILLNQIHSSKYYFINKKNKINKKFKGDALITNLSKVAIGILTADCVPILIYDKKLKIVSAVHAGWRGIYKKIVVKVIKFFKKKGSNLNDLNVSIGPCISQKSYEVKKDFITKFIKKDKKNKVFFKKVKNKTYFSLNKCVSYQLKKIGIKNIEIINKDTFNKNNNFFSARRSLLRKEIDYGRNISVIMIN